MLQETIYRLQDIIAPDNTYVITGGAHAVAVARQLPELSEGQIIVEPAPRGTGPAIGLGAALIARHDPDAIMGSFAADHYVTKPDVFQRAVMVAADAARQGYLVTIGITPTYPETGYGYICSGDTLMEQDDFSVRNVKEFREKPDAETAKAFVQSGQYLWNASMFVWRVSTLLDEMRRLLPGVYEILAEIAASWDSPQQDEILARLWPQVEDVTIDHGVMEHASRVAVVPADMGWTDLGDWNSLTQILSDESGGNVTVNGTHIAEDTSSTLVFGNGRTIATLGVDNLVIVDTDDVLLVCDRSRAQDVRKIVQRLQRDGNTLLT